MDAGDVVTPVGNHDVTRFQAILAKIPISDRAILDMTAPSLIDKVEDMYAEGMRRATLRSLVPKSRAKRIAFMADIILQACALSDGEPPADLLDGLPVKPDEREAAWREWRARMADLR